MKKKKMSKDNTINNKVQAYHALKHQSENELNDILSDINRGSHWFYKVMCRQELVLGVFSTREKADEFIEKIRNHMIEKKLDITVPMRVKEFERFTVNTMPRWIDDVPLDQAIISYRFYNK
jgi:hypothetical protein